MLEVLFREHCSKEIFLTFNEAEGWAHKKVSNKTVRTLKGMMWLRKIKCGESTTNFIALVWLWIAIRYSYNWVALGLLFGLPRLLHFKCKRMQQDKVWVFWSMHFYSNRIETACERETNMSLMSKNNTVDSP